MKEHQNNNNNHKTRYIKHCIPICFIQEQRRSERLCEGVEDTQHMTEWGWEKATSIPVFSPLLILLSRLYAANLYFLSNTYKYEGYKPSAQDYAASILFLFHFVMDSHQVNIVTESVYLQMFPDSWGTRAWTIRIVHILIIGTPDVLGAKFQFRHQRNLSDLGVGIKTYAQGSHCLEIQILGSVLWRVSTLTDTRIYITPSNITSGS